MWMHKGLWSVQWVTSDHGYHILSLVPWPENCLWSVWVCRPAASRSPARQPRPDAREGPRWPRWNSFLEWWTSSASGVVPFRNQVLPSPPGVSGPETWLLASSAGQLLHPHRLGTHEQSQQWPQSPADLPLHQVTVRQRWSTCKYTGKINFFFI